MTVVASSIEERADGADTDGTRAPLAEIRDLHVSFGDREVVKGVSFTVDAGECLAIVGESGSGKSVTARTLIGLTGEGARISAATIAFDGRSMLGYKDRDWHRLRGREIGFVLQDALVSLDQLRTVGSEIGEALTAHSDSRGGGVFRSRSPLRRADREEKIVELLTLVGVPEPRVRAAQRPHELSGGLRQRALIASALAQDPKLLIADEPTTALDATVQAQILDVLGEAKARGNGVILISHDLAVVARLADRVAVMRHGEIVEYGSTDQVLRNPTHEYTESLLASVPSRTSKGTLLTSGETLPEPTAASGTHATPALRVRDLRKSFEGKHNTARPAVRGVSFDVLPGKTLGIVGESGSGKTTTARMVLGLTDPDAGTVELNGRPWSALTDVERRVNRHQISVIYQDPLSSFDPRWNVERILRDSLRSRGLRGKALDEGISELLDSVGLSDAFRWRHPLHLSGGQRQRVAIARALAPEPSVIVCDEPVSALDVSIQARILDLLAMLQVETGVSLVFISHDLGVIHHVADDILVMRGGEVVEYGDADRVFGNPEHPYTRELLAAVPTVDGGELIA
ncbi:MULTISPECIES: dipeptide ABC transporter ATP-binding protein [Gordonia]|uniref:dipeptide ABC transporter ATP-binding protein n=1 Tax=Gordonia TaxID=2053 RepID=UPI001331B16B|nr:MULTISPECIES: ABC transporter ATP-binding protein [Gordonia]KAF0967688.1 Glutathione import ATP-binding protein GsiA [Gordonia sp. YY1]UPW14270.1 ABC transporter ATP-binding protein [Gordonia amicalis]